MDKVEVFQILGIEMTKDEGIIKKAYREKLTVTNPEDNPQGFRQLRTAYEEACRLARQDEDEEEQLKDETPSGIWVEKAAGIYGNIRRRRNVEEWNALFSEDCFLALEEEENCRVKLLTFLMNHFRLPGEVWKLLDKKLSLTADAAALREKFPADFLRYILNKCERGEDVEFDQFEGEDEAPYDLFLQYYDRCWQALQKNDLEQAEQNIKSADELNIYHPVIEICRADLLAQKGQIEEAVALMESQREKYPQDTMICYNAAETLWSRRKKEDGNYGRRAVEIYKDLKAENDSHYMANVRLTEWYYEEKQFREAKKCAEKVLSAGGGEEFMELLGKVNKEIERELEESWREKEDWESGLELCWCYLQDSRAASGLRLALKLEKMIPPEKEAEWNGLMAKLYVEAADYEDSIAMTRLWEVSLQKKLLTDETEEEKEKDEDRLKQAHMIRMECYHNLGFKDASKFGEAIKEGESSLEGTAKDIGVLLEMAQVYIEMEEYEKCEEIVRKLVEDYQIYAACAVALEAYRRQMNAGGVIRAASQCIQQFPDFAKAYEYMAKVYLDLDRQEDLNKVFEEAEKNGVKSTVLEAYKYQREKKPMGIELLNMKLKEFRKDYSKPVEKGQLVFYESGLLKLTEYLYNCPDSYMFVERGIFHRVAHHYEEAKADFEKALSLNPTNIYALNGLSFLYKYLGNYEKALFYIKRAILYMDKEMSPVIYTDMADLYSLLGMYDMALAACKQYEEIVEDKNVWFLKQLAAVYLNLGDGEKACEISGRYFSKNQIESRSEQVNAYMNCNQPDKARQILEQWRTSLLAAKPLLRFPIQRFLKKDDELSSYYFNLAWVELIEGHGAAAAKAFERSLEQRVSQEVAEDRLGDAIFSFILCGDKKRGRKYSRVLKNRLNQKKFAAGDEYFNYQKMKLREDILASWYTLSDEEIQEMLEKETSCEICHHCTSPICRELEGVRILFLLRQGKREEAMQRLQRNQEIQPSNEYMLAIKNWADKKLL